MAFNQYDSVILRGWQLLWMRILSKNSNTSTNSSLNGFYYWTQNYDTKQSDGGLNSFNSTSNSNTKIQLNFPI